GTADAAVDRRQHLGVAHVDARLFQAGLRLQEGGARLVVGLLAHGVVLDQLGVALGARAGGGQGGLGAFQGGLVDGGVDLVQLLTGLHLAALVEQALLDDAVDLRTHLGAAVGGGAARQLGGQRVSLGIKGNDADQRGRRRGVSLGRSLILASSKQCRNRKRGNQSHMGGLDRHGQPREDGNRRREKRTTSDLGPLLHGEFDGAIYLHS